MRVGYSDTPLLRKLGLKPGLRACFLHAPAVFFDLLGPLPDGLLRVDVLEEGLDYLHYFTTAQADLAARFPSLKQHLAADGMLWVSWPKRTSKQASDLTEDLVRQIGLAAGLVDVKVCAVDADWSGLKFVYRRKDRPGGGSSRQPHTG